MTSAAQGDVVQLSAAGTASSAGFSWRGGLAAVLVDNLSGTPSVEIQTPSGAWVAAHDLNGDIITAGATDLHFTATLPACKVRLSAGGGAMNAWLVGI